MVAARATAQIVNPSPQTVNVQDSGTACSVAGTCAVWDIIAQPSYTITAAAAPTFSGTLTIQTTGDGRTWLTTSVVSKATGGLVTTMTAAGAVQLTNTGILRVRVVGTTVSSGAMTLTLTAGTASAMGGSGGGGGGGSVTGGTCTNQVATAIDTSGIPTCTTVSSAYADTSIAQTGVDINTSFQVTASHFPATGMSTWITTPSSANLFTAMTTKTGSGGSLVFATGPTLAAPIFTGTATGASFSLSSLAGSGVRCTQVDNVGLFSVAAAACGGSGATAALDNLAAVNINSALLYQTGIDTGSTTKPFRNLFLYGSGTYGSTYIELTGTPTGARVLTLPNATDTLVGQTTTDTLQNKTFVAPALGTPASGNMANTTGFLVANLGGLSSGIATFLGTATATNLATTLGSQAANTFFASPDGAAGNSAFRTLTSGDLPAAITETVLTVATAISAYNGAYASNCSMACTHTLPTTASHAGQTAAFRGVGGSSNYTLDPASSQNVCDSSGCATTKTYSANQSVNLIIDTTGAYWQVVSSERGAGGSSTVYPKAPGSRLTTQSGTCKSTADRTAQGTLYYTPAGACGGSSYAVAYSGSAWVEFTQAELSLSLTLTSGKAYDVYYCYNSGTPNLALSAAWTNDTTRSEAQGTQDGFVVKSSDHTCLNVGTIYASGSNVTEDSKANAYVWNRFVQMPHDLGVVETTDSWSYSTVTWRQARATATNQINYVTGDATTRAEATVVVSWDGASVSGAAIGIGVDSTTTPSRLRSGAFSPDASNEYALIAHYQGYPGLGKHSLVWLETGTVGAMSTFIGDDGGTIQQSGIDGTVLD